MRQLEMWNQRLDHQNDADFSQNELYSPIGRQQNANNFPMIVDNNLQLRLKNPRNPMLESDDGQPQRKDSREDDFEGFDLD